MPGLHDGLQIHYATDQNLRSPSGFYLLCIMHIRASRSYLFAQQRPVLTLVTAAVLFSLFGVGSGEMLAQVPTPAPVFIPLPAPTATPSETPVAPPAPTPVGGGTPVVTITPGIPNVSEMEAYNAARTPQVSVTLGTVATPTTSTNTITSGAGSPATATIRPAVLGGACTLITLPAATKSKRPRSSASASSTTQPIATVVLTYNSGNAGQLVWVQALRGGALTATDEDGKTYDGGKGFFLTLDASGVGTFAYQAPDADGTYQVFTRFSNVVTTLPFVVPDSAP